MFPYGVIFFVASLREYCSKLAPFDQYSRNAPLRHPIAGTLSFRAAFHSLDVGYINVLPRAWEAPYNGRDDTIVCVPPVIHKRLACWHEAIPLCWLFWTYGAAAVAPIFCCDDQVQPVSFFLTFILYFAVVTWVQLKCMLCFVSVWIKFGMTTYLTEQKNETNQGITLVSIFFIGETPWAPRVRVGTRTRGSANGSMPRPLN